MEVKGNYHIHSFYCRHGEGQIEEYVLEAIKHGFTDFGISEHVCLTDEYAQFNGWDVRMYEHQLDDYLNDVKTLKQKYQNQINLYLGFECEYLPQFLELYRSYVETKGVEYLILGHHFTQDYKRSYRREVVVSEYFETMFDAIKTNLFSFVAHPDSFQILEMTDEIASYIKQLCELIKKYDMALELNVNGLRKQAVRIEDSMEYPRVNFWTEVAKYDVKVMINSDAHEVSHIMVDAYDHLYEFAKSLNLNVVEEIRLYKDRVKL